MPAINQDITHYAGDNATISIGPIKDENGVPVDLGGATARWWMAKAVTSTVPSEIFLKKEANPDIVVTRLDTDNWIVVIKIYKGDTDTPHSGIKPATYYHECEVVDADSNVSTVCVGKFILKPTVIPDIFP